MASRILLVEDDKNVSTLIARLLAQHGYIVIEAENGRIAMERMSQQRADLVITDMIMPEMDGVETILAVRRFHPSVKIIAIAESGFNPAENSLKIARMLGSHKTLTKPIAPDELLDAVEELIG